jgi:hypothetical protein
MIRVEQTIGSDKRIPFSVVWTDANRLRSTTPTRNADSVCHTAVGELKLTCIQLAAGCICFLGAIRLALWAALKLWLFEP